MERRRTARSVRGHAGDGRQMGTVLSGSDGCSAAGFPLGGHSMHCRTIPPDELDFNLLSTPRGQLHSHFHTLTHSHAHTIHTAHTLTLLTLSHFTHLDSLFAHSYIHVHASC